jgi:hypothetical protein
LRQQWTGIAKEEEELQDLRDLNKSFSEYTNNTTKFYDEATEYLKQWQNTPLSTTDPYNPPNVTFGEASTSTDNVTFGTASVGTDNVTFGNASTSTRELERDAQLSSVMKKEMKKKARANVNSKGNQTPFDPYIRVKEVKIQYPNDVKVLNKTDFSRKGYKTRIHRLPHKNNVMRSRESRKNKKKILAYNLRWLGSVAWTSICPLLRARLTDFIYNFFMRLIERRDIQCSDAKRVIVWGGSDQNPDSARP